MTTTANATRPLQTSLFQQVLSLGLAAVITGVVLVGLLGEAGGDRAALMANQQRPAAPQATAAVPVAPAA